MKSITIEIPTKLPAELGSNSSRMCPDGLKWKLLNDIEELAHVCIVSARNTLLWTDNAEWKPLKKAKCDVYFIYTEDRKRDTDNLIGNRGWKKIQDLLVQDEIICEDNSKVFKVEGHIEIGEEAMIRLVIKEMK